MFLGLGRITILKQPLRRTLVHGISIQQDERPDLFLPGIEDRNWKQE